MPGKRGFRRGKLNDRRNGFSPPANLMFACVWSRFKSLASRINLSP